MPVRSFEFLVKLPNGVQQKMVVQADSPQNAKLMLETQYGKGKAVMTREIR